MGASCLKKIAMNNENCSGSIWHASWWWWWWLWWYSFVVIYLFSCILWFGWHNNVKQPDMTSLLTSIDYRCITITMLQTPFFFFFIHGWWLLTLFVSLWYMLSVPNTAANTMCSRSSNKIYEKSMKIVWKW